MAYKAGEMLGDYRICYLLGSGGLCEVYLATNASGQQVAIKVLMPRLSGDRARMRLQQEILTLSGLGHHPHIPAYISSGETSSGILYLVMECLQNVRNLFDFTRLYPHKRLDWKLATHILIRISRTVGYGHKRGIVHRDLKPENILVTQKASGSITVYVIDFGLAWLENQSLRLPGERITPVGMAPGTPQFMSPEQIGAAPIDTRTDVHSLGLILYYLITGSDFYAPFTGLYPNIHTYAQHRRKTSIHSRHPAIPTHVWRVIKECLSENPTKRPPDGFALAARLERAMRQSKRGR